MPGMATADAVTGMTAAQKCIVWLVAAATSFLTGSVLISMSNSNQTSAGWGTVGGLLFLAAVPLAVVGLFWLIRAATNPGS